MIPLPPGFGLVLDGSTREYRDGRVLMGGTPGRLMRLSDTGRQALAGLLSGRDGSPAALRLARALVDAGMAHPRPPRDAPGPAATVVIPVRDRPAELDRCLAALAGGPPVLVVDDGSADPAAVADACRRHGARLVAQEASTGPAGARNRALSEVDTELVAFLDSDCVAPAGWCAQLSAHFADPLLAAVAPRIRPLDAPRPGTVRQRYASARSPLDLGEREGDVGPGRPVPYVPTAALVVRRSALGTGFDRDLRYGEDVDLVWRLRDAGWRVRYDPAVVVRHDEPGSWRELLTRRFRYGTSAGPLSRRHPARLAPAVLRPWPALTCLLLLAGRPRASLAVAAASGVRLSAGLRGTGVPLRRSATLPVQAAAQTLVGAGRAGTMLAAPVLAAGVAHRRTRLPSLALLLGLPLLEWSRRRPRLDPIRWTAASVADDVAYGLGVWRGCLAARTCAPLTPSLGATAGPGQTGA